MKPEEYTLNKDTNNLEETTTKSQSWTDNIPPQGVICWVKNKFQELERIEIIYEYTGGTYPYVGRFQSFREAWPVMPEECWPANKRINNDG